VSSPERQPEPKQNVLPYPKAHQMAKFMQINPDVCIFYTELKNE